MWNQELFFNFWPVFKMSSLPKWPSRLSAPQTLSDSQRPWKTHWQRFPVSFPRGAFCARTWDGSLCWDETPAGTSVTRTCPGRPELDAAAGEEPGRTRWLTWEQRGRTELSARPLETSQVDRKTQTMMGSRSGVKGHEAERVNRVNESWEV